MSESSSLPFARIPAVDKVLVALDKAGDLPPLPQPLVTKLVRDTVDEMRKGVKKGELDVGEFEETLAMIRGQIDSLYPRERWP